MPATRAPEGMQPEWRRVTQDTPSPRDGLLCRRLSGTGRLHLRPGRRIGTRTRAGDRRDEAGLVEDAQQARLVDPGEGVPARTTDQVRAAQPVQEARGEGVPRTDGVDE